MKVLEIFLCYSILVSSSISPIYVDNFFNLNGVLSEVTWAHNVHNQSLLAQVLETDVMMIQANVVVGNLQISILNNNPSVILPIISLSSTLSSDLSLDLLLKEISLYNNRTSSSITPKGVKLDFKSTDALSASVEILNEYYSQITFPIWLSADILSGPQTPTSVLPINHRRFLEFVTHFPEFTVCVGWKTSYGFKKTGFYSPAQIASMLNVLRQFPTIRNVIFSVRAGMAALSADQMQALLTNASHSKLHIWSSETDPFDVRSLKNLLLKIGLNRVYVDLPEANRTALGIAKHSGSNQYLATKTILLLHLIIVTYSFI